MISGVYGKLNGADVKSISELSNTGGGGNNSSIEHPAAMINE